MARISPRTRRRGGSNLAEFCAAGPPPSTKPTANVAVIGKERDSRSVGVTGLAIAELLREESVELLALGVGRVVDLERATLRDDLFGGVRADETLEARRLQVPASVRSECRRRLQRHDGGERDDDDVLATTA